MVNWWKKRQQKETEKKKQKNKTKQNTKRKMEWIKRYFGIVSSTNK